MKSFLFSTLFVLLVITGHSQCNPYFILKEGAKWEVKSYDGKGKFQGTSQYSVSNLSESGNGYAADIEMKMMDKKNKEFMDQVLNVECKEGTLHYDMKQFMPQESQKAFEGMNFQIDAENLEYPNNLQAGDKLKDAQMLISMTSENLPINMDMVIKIKDRKVDTKETITTPAGTFECYKISSTMSSKTLGVIETKMVEWIAPGRGVVKSETYNRKGKKINYSEMVSYTE